MKKALIALPFVATASWAGTTLYSGTQTRSAYDDLVAQLDLSTTFKVSNESYDAGFARSQAITKVSSGSGPDAEVLLRIHHDIDHSPIGFDEDGTRVSAARIESTLETGNAEGAYADFLAAFESGTPFLMVSSAGFNGTIESSLTMAPMDWTVNETRIKSAGLKYAFTQDAAGKVIGAGGFEPFSITTPETIFSATSSNDSYEFDYLSEAVLIGTQTTSFERFTIQNLATGIEFGLENVDFTLASDVQDDLMDTSLMMNVGSIQSDMPIPLDSFDFGMSISNISLAASDRINALNNRYIVMSLDDPESAEALNTIADLYREMIVPGSALEYSLSLHNEGGDVTGKTIMTFEGDGSATGYDTLETLGDLANALKLTADLDADENAVAMTPATMFLANGSLAPWIVSTDTGYSSRIVIEDAQLETNGTSFPLEMMMGELLTMPLNMSTLAELGEQ